MEEENNRRVNSAVMNATQGQVTILGENTENPRILSNGSVSDRGERE